MLRTKGACPLFRPDVSGLVLTTTCDQMRYVAAMLEQRGDRPVFLLNVPSTWQTPAARRLYLDELRRLGRFLVRSAEKRQATPNWRTSCSPSIACARRQGE